MSDPLAYFITFSCYGGWLHGDRRGSIDRKHNEPGSPPLEPSREREATAQGRLKHGTFLLDAPRRVAVEDAVRGVSDARGWQLVAVNVRTSHVHVVVAADQAPELVMRAFKAWSTRQMRDRRLMDADASAWSRHGSTRYLWDTRDVEEACQYVVHGQGPPLSRA